MARATKFHTLESEGTAGPSRITQTRKHFQGSRTTRGGSGLSNTAAADHWFTALLLVGSYAIGFVGAVNV